MCTSGALFKDFSGCQPCKFETFLNKSFRCEIFVGPFLTAVRHISTRRSEFGVVPCG